jgi:hypothetical protein
MSATAVRGDIGVLQILNRIGWEEEKIKTGILSHFPLVPRTIIMAYCDQVPLFGVDDVSSVSAEDVNIGESARLKARSVQFR